MPESLQEFYDRHKDFVYSYVLCAFGGNVREAKRLVLLVFREFFEKAEPNQKNLKDDFLHSLLRRRVRSYIRENKKVLQDMPPPSSYQTRLQAALGSLPQLQQDCVLFKYIYGLTPRPLSRLLDKTEASIRQNLSRGTKRVFDLMDDENLDSRNFRIPLSQIPSSLDQRLKIQFNTPLPSIDLPLEGIGKKLSQFRVLISRKKLISLGIILLIIGGIGELPKFVYKQGWIVPGNALYSWKKNMELKKLEALRHPANLSNFYLSLSNRRIKEAYHLSQKQSFLSFLWSEAFAQEYEPRTFPLITFGVNPKNAPQSSLVAESGLMIQRAIEYAGNIDQPTTLINVLKNIRVALETQQAYLSEIAQWSHEPQMEAMSQSISLIHQLNIKIIENAGQQVAEQALASEAHLEPLSPVPIQIIIHREAEDSLGPVAESIRIHQQFRPMIRPQDEAIKSFAEVNLEVDQTMNTPEISDGATIESLVRKIEDIHFPDKAKSSAKKKKEKAPAKPKKKVVEEALFEKPETSVTKTVEKETIASEPETVVEAQTTPEPTSKDDIPEVVEEVPEIIEQPIERQQPETEVEELPEPKVEVESLPEPKVEEVPTPAENEKEPEVPAAETGAEVEAPEEKPTTNIPVNQEIDTEAIKALSGDKQKEESETVPVEVPEADVPELEIQKEETPEEEVEIRS